MKMVMISADDYEKLSNAKKESETKIESYKQCIAGYESRIKELTEERDKLKYASFDMYKKLTADNKRLAKTVLNSAYGVEQDICCRISKNLNASMFDKISELSDENHKLKIEVSSLETQLKDCKYMYENKLKNTEATLKAVAIDNNVNNSFIKTLRRQAEEDANKMKELRQKYEAVIKANEKLAAENSRLANDPEITRLNNELKILKKHFKDLDNAYKSQKNELLKLKNNPDAKYDILFEQYNRLHTDYELAKMDIDDYKKKIYEIQSLANV